MATILQGISGLGWKNQLSSLTYGVQCSSCPGGFFESEDFPASVSDEEDGTSFSGSSWRLKSSVWLKIKYNIDDVIFT